MWYSNPNLSHHLIRQIIITEGSQFLNLQKNALIDSEVDEERLYHDDISIKTGSRLALEACFKAFQPGNMFVVWKLDLLGHSLKEFVTMIEELYYRKIGFKVLVGHGMQI